MSQSLDYVRHLRGAPLRLRIVIMGGSRAAVSDPATIRGPRPVQHNGGRGVGSNTVVRSWF
jgi:hypothetical protein